jgi:hypothetical protein
VSKDQLTLFVLVKVLAGQFLGSAMGIQEIRRRFIQQTFAITTT